METAKDLNPGDTAYYYEAGNVYKVDIVQNNRINNKDNLELHLKRAVCLFEPNGLFTTPEGNFYPENSNRVILTREELEKMVESSGTVSLDEFREKEKETSQSYGDLPKTLTEISRHFLDLRERYTRQLDPSVYPVYFSSSLNLYTEIENTLFLFKRNGSFCPNPTEIMPGTTIIGSLPPGSRDKEEPNLYLGGLGPKTVSHIVPEVIEGNQIIYLQTAIPGSHLENDVPIPNYGYSSPVRRVDLVKKEECPTGSTEEIKAYLLERFKTQLRFHSENLRKMVA